MRRHRPATTAAPVFVLMAALVCAAVPPAAAETFGVRRLFVTEHAISRSPPQGTGFVSRTEIWFTIVRPGPVRLRVLDTRGRRVRTLVDDVRAPGAHEVWWNGKRDDGTTAPGGLYYVALSAPGEDLREVARIWRFRGRVASR